MRRRTPSLVLCSLLALPLAGACGASESKKTTEAVPTIHDLSQGLCDFAFRCCEQGEIGFYFGPYLTKDTCTDRLLEATEVSSGLSLQLPSFPWLQAVLPNVGALDRAIQEGRSSVDATALKACIDDLGKEACNARPKKDDTKTCKPLDPPAEKTVCEPRKIFVGKVAEGDPCTSGGASFECAPGLLCARTGSLGQQGECVRAGKEGDYCVVDGNGSGTGALGTGGCDTGLYCSLLDGKCRTPRAEGEPCVYADHLDPRPDPATLLVACRSDLSCDPITDSCVARCAPGAECGSDKDCDDTQKLKCIVGHCGTVRTEGLPCATDTDCDTALYCAPDLTQPGQSACRAQKAIGQACSSTEGGSRPHAQCESGFCDPRLDQCAAQVAPGGACSSRLREECKGGNCRSTFNTCVADADCSGGHCDLTSGQCTPFCVALKTEGAICTVDDDCESSACIAGFCKTPPLADGEKCESDSQCDSAFCGVEKVRVCTRLPLAIGDACSSSTQCDSLVCYGGGVSTLGSGGSGTGGFDFGTGGYTFGTGGYTFGTGGSSFGLTVPPTCTAGLGEGERCGTSDKPACDPKQFFCNSDQDPPKCAPFHETGASCKRDQECRGSCVITAGRKMCDDTPRPDGAVCDGTP